MKIEDSLQILMNSVFRDRKKVVYYGPKEWFINTAIFLARRNIRISSIFTDHYIWNSKSKYYRNIEFIYINDIADCEDSYVLLKINIEISSLILELNIQIIDFSEIVIKCGNTIYNVLPMFDDWIIHYIANYVQKAGKKIVLYGEKIQVSRAENELYSSGIQVAYGVTENEEETIQGRIRIRNKYDLIYEDGSQLYLFILTPKSYEVDQLIYELGLEYDCYSINACVNYRWKQTLDPNLGYTYKYKNEIGFSTIENKEDGANPIVSIAILGGSTSDFRCYHGMHKSWVEWLYEKVKNRNINLKIINGGVAGYNVAQETVKLIRDVVLLRPDIVISYSGINQVGWVMSENNFVHPHQFKLFEALQKARQDEHVFTTSTDAIWNGISDENRASHWIRMEQIMHAICEEFSIRFYGFIQPCLATKTPISLYDAEIMECYDSQSFVGTRELMQEISTECRELNKSWLIDFTQLFNNINEDIFFDSCHCTSQGNKIVAEEIYKYIENDLLTIWENRE